MIDALFWMLASVFSIITAPFVLYLLSIIVANVLNRQDSLDTGENIKFAVLVPAHNESASILETIHSLQAIHYPQNKYHIIVIADNCDDDTADIATNAGAEVWKRVNKQKRGKGYALEMAVDRLMAESPRVDAIMIVDADTLVHPDILKRSAHLINTGEDWIQAYYTVSNSNVSWRTRLSYLSFALINGILSRGQDLLGLGALLRGNGMIYTTRGIERIPLKAYGLAEDIEFGWRLRLASERVRFVRDVFVSGEMVSQSGAAADSQRLRWEHGRRVVKQQFFHEIMKSDFSIWKKLLFLVDLGMPPLSRLVGFIIAGILFSAMQMGWLFYLNLAFLGIILIYLVTPSLFLGFPLTYYLSIFSVPKYFAWKIRLMFKKKPSTWIRTGREKESV